ncbi:unnamed protein product [Lactuca saligna]|uniref:Uncharacterized protein n=1 Tax=Lactuca saligna TaxID=75948 RepID=A0AA36A3F6_LACSI|nr:unnamed protein product [Lactuca saligna]
MLLLLVKHFEINPSSCAARLSAAMRSSSATRQVPHARFSTLTSSRLASQLDSINGMLCQRGSKLSTFAYMNPRDAFPRDVLMIAGSQARSIPRDALPRDLSTIVSSQARSIPRDALSRDLSTIAGNQARSVPLNAFPCNISMNVGC